MNEIVQRIGALGIVPVVVLDSADDAKPLAEALIAGGLPCAEVTFRTSAAAQAIRTIAAAFPEMLLGAGTVLTPDQVKAAVDAGARFIVSPGTSEKVVKTCIEVGVPVMPGVATPTEVQMALELGVDVMKFFPAEAAGGVPYLKALSAPFKQVRFVPTGGIDESTMLSYLGLPAVLAVGGSWMVKPELVAAKKFNEIERLAGQATAQARSRKS